MNKKNILLLTSFLLMGTLAACGNDNAEESASETEIEETTDGEVAEDSVETDEIDEEEDEGSKTTELSVEKETAAEFEEREEVERAIIQLETIGEKQFINAHLSVTEGQDVKALESEYKELLMEQYDGRILDLIISSGDEILLQETYE